VFQALASLDPLLSYLESLEGGERGRRRRPDRRGDDDDDDGTVGGGGRHVGPPADPAVRERGGGRRGKEDGEVGDDRPLLRNYDYDDDDIALVVVAVLFLLRGHVRAVMNAVAARHPQFRSSGRNGISPLSAGAHE